VQPTAASVRVSVELYTHEIPTILHGLGGRGSGIVIGREIGGKLTVGVKGEALTVRDTLGRPVVVIGLLTLGCPLLLPEIKEGSFTPFP
jgi:hypothetical protein